MIDQESQLIWGPWQKEIRETIARESQGRERHCIRGDLQLVLGEKTLPCGDEEHHEGKDRHHRNDSEDQHAASLTLLAPMIAQHRHWDTHL